MAKKEHRTIKVAPLTNNCPECFNQDLTLTFSQKHIHTPIYHKVTSELSRELKCNTCQTVIYPVSWTEDIERSVSYYQKAVQPDRSTIRFRPLFFILLLLGILCVGVLTYLRLNGLI
ncbi:MAG: hypothetical protein P8X60_04210 [Robiginitalea sp.]|jgi:hypothetical protein